MTNYVERKLLEWFKPSFEYMDAINPTPPLAPEQRLALAIITQALTDCFELRGRVDPEDHASARAFLSAPTGPDRADRLYWLRVLSDQPERYDAWLQERLAALATEKGLRITP